MTGPRPAWRQGVIALNAITTRYVYRRRRFVVVRTELVGPPVPDRIGEIVFRPATPFDLDHLGELERSHRAYVKNDRDLLFVAGHGDRIVATRRYSHALPTASRDGHGLMGRLLQLGPGQIWTADTFFLPEYRNQGLNYHFGRFTMRFLASLGYAEQIGTIAAANIPALRSSRRRGAECIYYVSYTRLFFYERLRLSKELPRRLAARLK